jgi:hypothetical protein
MYRFKQFLEEKVTHTALSAIKSILPAHRVYTDKDIEQHDNNIANNKQTTGIHHRAIFVTTYKHTDDHYDHEVWKASPKKKRSKQFHPQKGLFRTHSDYDARVHNKANDADVMHTGTIHIRSLTSRAPEHVAIAAHEAHHALIYHNIPGGHLYANEHIVNRLTRKWIDKHYTGSDRARAHAAIDVSVASHKNRLPGQWNSGSRKSNHPYYTRKVNKT